MKKIFNRKNGFLYDTGLQDVIFLVGIFLYISIMIIGLFPGEDLGVIMNRDFLIYSVMTVPILVAIYFIVISFRRTLYSDSALIGSSIRKKMALAFVFVAVLPSIPIVLVSNFMINKTMSQLIFSKTAKALNQAIVITQEPGNHLHKVMGKDLHALQYMLKNNVIQIDSLQGRKHIAEIARRKDIDVLFYSGTEKGHTAIALQDPGKRPDYIKEIRRFYNTVNIESVRIDKISINGTKYISGALKYRPYMIIFYRQFPSEIIESVSLYTRSLEYFNQLERLFLNFKGRAGIYFLGLSIVIIVISVLVSLYLSKNITRPVLRLTDAAKKVASGNFTVEVEHDSEDELGLLYQSFNQMVNDLDKTRKTMYQKQRLEAWREMAKRVVHEIKNPLTPIRLSAERMRKRFMENHSDIQNIILTGTETIISEVDALMNILSEFTKFARLPEMSPDKIDINPLIENCINVFSGHEKISFNLDLDSSIPSLYIDKILMRQALINLIQNAVDALDEEGDITISSKISLLNGFKTVKIVVADNGNGIKPEDRESVFNPGYSTKPHGTGLGLAIVEKIIMEHLGRITFSSYLGKGTEFIIDLPIIEKEEIVYGQNTDS